MHARPALLISSSLLSLLCWGCVTDEVPAPADPLSPGHCTYQPAPVPQAAPAPGPGAVRAGVAEVPLDLPVGTPLGGYSNRLTLLGGKGPDDRQSPYAKTFVPSGGIQSRPQARALFLQAGADQLLLIKVDVCVSFDRLVYDLEQALGPDGHLRGRVIVATSHSHSAWATYQGVFHLALGFDLFQESQYQRLLASLVQAGKQAIAQAGPARLGAAVWDGWDPRDEIYHDRRGEDDMLPGLDGKPLGPHKDGRLLVLRVDDAQQQPLAVLFHFPMHGTVADEGNPLASVDSTGHVELALEEYFDRRVMVAHLQGPAGDSSPSGQGGIVSCDDKKMLCPNFARMESIGELAAPRIYEMWRAMQTTDQAELEVVTRAVGDGRALSVRGGMTYAPYDDSRTIDDSHDAIYTPDGQVRSPITQFNIPYGAGLCGSQMPQLPVTGIDGASTIPYGSCVEIGAASKFIAGLLKEDPPVLPECETTRTTMTALRLGGMPVVRRLSMGAGPPIFQEKSEDLLFVTMPGEPVSRLADILRSRSPAGADDTFVLGYAQGHIGYILEVENWLVGGYEPSINIYGPLEGEWLMERALELAALAWSPQREDAEARTGGGRYDRLAFAPGNAQPAASMPALMAGQVPAAPPADLFVRTHQVPAQGQPPASVLRVAGRATFVFYGGNPAEDTPQVTLQREVTPGQWQAVTRRNGRPLDTRGRDVKILTYTPEPVTAPPAQVQQHLWAVEWQAIGWDRDASQVIDVTGAPVGNYRFAAAGRAQGQDYQVQSNAFAVVASGAISVTAARNGAQVSGKAVYPVGAGYRLLRLDRPSDGDVAVAGTVTVTVRSNADGTSQQVAATPDASGQFSVQTIGLDLHAGAAVTVTDPDGNSGAAMAP